MPKEFKFTPGSLRSLPAEFLNQLATMLRWFQTQQIGTSGQTTFSPPSSGIVKVKNDSGADVARFGVLGLDDAVFSPSDSLTAFKNDVAFLGVIPTAAHAGKFCVLLEPLKDGKVGPAVVSGMVQVQVEVDASELSALPFCFADVTPNDTTKLTAGYSGAARIDYKPTGSGTKWAYVNLGGHSQRLTHWAKFKETGTWDLGDSLTMDLCDEGRTTLSTDITVWNYFMSGIEKTTAKNVFIMGSAQKMILANVDPCA